MRNMSDEYLPIFFISYRLAPENFSAISTPTLKECDPTWSLMIPLFSRPSETMALLTFTLMSSSVTWYFVPLSQQERINSFFSDLLSQRCTKRHTKYFTGQFGTYIALRWIILPQISFFWLLNRKFAAVAWSNTDNGSYLDIVVLSFWKPYIKN